MNVVDCQSYAVDIGIVPVGVLEAVGAILLGIGLVAHDVKTTVTLAPTFAWRDGPRLGLTAHF